MSTFTVNFYSVKPYDETFFERTRPSCEQQIGRRLRFVFNKERLTVETAGAIVRGTVDAVCIFVNDDGSAPVLRTLAARGVGLLLLRCAGFNNVDLVCARSLGMPVMRVPRYSPNAVAEHAATLLMSLTRHIPQASQRIRAHDFSLEGLEGHDLCHKTFGVVGTGAIGRISARILAGFGGRVYAYDPRPDPQWAARLGVQYVPLDELFRRCNVITLHVPLTPQNHHMINARTLALMPAGVTIINTSRGGLIDTRAAVDALLSGKIAGLGIDVYEGETPYFFGDHSREPMQDPLLAHLISMPNVIMTVCRFPSHLLVPFVLVFETFLTLLLSSLFPQGHQAFFTEDALTAISEVTLGNLALYLRGRAAALQSPNECTHTAAAPLPKKQTFAHESVLKAKL